MSTELPGFDETKFMLGSLCKRGHDWEGTGKSLRAIVLSGRFQGKSANCIECNRISCRDRYWANVEKNREISKNYYLKNAESVKARQRAWGKANRERKRQADRKYAAANRERAKAKARAWALANPLRKKASNRAWAIANREKLKQSYARWLACPANKEKVTAWRRAWEAANREKCRQKYRRRRDHEKKAIIIKSLTSVQIKSRLEQFSNTCAYCGACTRLEIDHFLPLCAGNALTLCNAIPACKSCNCRKSSSDPWEWYSRQPFFCQKRWDRILKILGKRKTHHGQMGFV